MMNSSQLRLGATMAPSEGERKNLNSELWHACAGPLVSLPAVGTRVVYFPQGHSEQVAASTQKEVNAHIPNYPNLPPQLVCQLHDVILHADLETDEVYCQMILQPVNLQERESFFVPDIGSQSRQPSNFFCKTLTASDTSTHGGFSIPRRAAEKVFPPLDYTQQPPAQELVTRDLHDTEWKFRHIYRGQPKRHLLTTGWSVFVSAKRLTAGDAVLFIRNEKGHLFLGIRRANRPPTALPSSVLSSDSMHIGVLAAAAHAASTNIRFTVFYNPRASPSDFVISHSKYEKAVYHTRVSVGMRFRMLFETEESSVRRYMGTITGIGDLDPVRWPNSQWRSIKVGWDESTAGERQRRVSLWEIEPLTAFLVYPPSSNWRFKHPWPQPISGSLTTDVELETLKKSSLWMQFQGINGAFPGSATQGLGGPNPLLGSMQQRYDAAPESDVYDALGAAALQEIYSSKQLHFQHPPSMQPPDQMLYRAQLHPHHHQSPFYYLPQQQQQQQQHQQHQQQTQRPFSSQQQMPAFQSAAVVPFSMQGDRKNSIFSQQPSPYGPACVERQVQQLHQHPLKQSHQPMQAVLPVQDQPQQAVHHTGQQQQVQVQQSQPALLQSSHSLQPQQQQQQSSLLQSPNQQPQHSLPQAYFPMFQPQTHATQPEQIHQQHLLSFPNAGNSFITQLPSPQQQTACSSIVGMPQLTSTEPPSTVASSTTGFQSSLQSILGNFVTDTSPLHSNAVPSVQPILRSGSEPLQDPLSWHPAATHVSTSGFQAEATTPAVYTAPQTDPLGLTKLSTTGLPCSPFGFRECPPEQDDLQSDLHRQTLFAVDDGLPSLAIPTMSPGLRSTNNGINEFRCMQGQSSASLDLPCSPDAFVEGPEDNGFSQQFPDLALPVRTYTKVYKIGSVGRSIDVTRFRNYEELREEVARLFGLEGQFEDPRSGWQLIFVDKENDWLLVGDDPWEEFITNVRSIRIVSPFDGPALTQDGVGSHAGFVSQRQASSSSEDGCIQQDPRRRSPAITSTCSLNY